MYSDGVFRSLGPQTASLGATFGTIEREEMTEAQAVTPIPPPAPAPRSLRTIRGARLELARLYAETKAGHIRPEVAGKLAHMLGLMISTARDHEFDARIGELEACLADHQAPGSADGHGAAAYRAQLGRR